LAIESPPSGTDRISSHFVSKMTFYIVQRLAAVVGVIALMSVLVFLATHALPATIAEVMLGQYATPETVAALESKLGLTRPLIAQYWEWASGILQGDLGRSLIMEVPIAPVLWSAFGRSAALGGAAMLVVAALGIALGVVAAVRRGRIVDHLASGFAIVGLSVPEFFWGLLLILLFGSYLRLFPTSGYGTLEQGVGWYTAHLVLPVATLAIGLLAHVARLTRSSMLEALDTDYVKSARTRGLPERAVVLRHALRNALLPTITVLAQDVGFLIGGIVAVETIFAYPGIGRLLVYALERHDLPLMEAVILVLTAVQCIANLAADLLYAALNPQIRYGRAVA
jgi:peptide/nickel transport system permease protein